MPPRDPFQQRVQKRQKRRPGRQMTSRGVTLHQAATFVTATAMVLLARLTVSSPTA
jgi:hypothetical protein